MKGLDRIKDLATRNNMRLQLILVILPQSAEHVRVKVKHWGDVKHGDKPGPSFIILLTLLSVQGF